MSNKWIVNDSKDQIRIDMFLSRKIENTSRRILQRIIDEGSVSVNNSCVQKNYMLHMGDVVCVKCNDLGSIHRVLPNTSVPMQVLYSDRNVVIVDKPAGIPTQPLDYYETETVLNGVIARFPDIEGVGEGMMSGVVQRLDVETSGVIVFARNNNTYKKLRNQFKRQTVLKEYLVLVSGELDGSEKLVDQVAHHPKSKKKMVVLRPSPSSFRGKPLDAELFYRTLEKYGDFTLLALRLRTGVMHQIRVQCAFHGFPVAGDKLYRPKNTDAKKERIFPRHFVHARKLGFHDPETGLWRVFRVPLADDLKEVLNSLQ